MIRRARIWLARKIHPGTAFLPRPTPQGRPMHEFFALGWLHELNRKVANPVGVHVGLYLNDDPLPDGTIDDGLLLYGWEAIPIEVARQWIMPEDEIAGQRESAWRRHIAEIRQSVDSPPSDMQR